MGGRGKRGKRLESWDAMPHEGMGVAAWRAWLLDDSPELVELPEAPVTRARRCALPECARQAAGGSIFCLGHQQTAVGEAGALELRQLQRELERMAQITGTEAKQHAARKLRSRVERGDFAVLFSGRMEELLERAAADARLGMELDVLREAMLRAFREIEDPGKMAVVISRIARASARMVRVDAEWRRERGKVRAACDKLGARLEPWFWGSIRCGEEISRLRCREKLDVTAGHRRTRRSCTTPSARASATCACYSTRRYVTVRSSSQCLSSWFS